MRDRCRCPACRAANTAASNARNRQRALGRWHPYVGAAPIREHIDALRAAGIGVDQIASLAGISASHVRRLTYPAGTGKPPIRRGRPHTAQRLLDVQVSHANRAPRSQVDATGTRRRLQALVASGWTRTRLAAELGRAPANLTRSMTSRQVTARTAGQVAELYERLWNVPPPHTTSTQRAAADAARRSAARRGWATPLAWDDIDTDPDPHHQDPVTGADADSGSDLDEIAIERAIAGDGIHLAHLTPAEQDEVIRRLTERGRSLRDIAAQLCTTKRTVSRRRRSMFAA